MGKLGTRRPAGAKAAVLAVVVAGVVATTVVRHTSDPHYAAVVTLLALVAGWIVATAVLVPWHRLPVSVADQKAALRSLPSAHVARSKELHSAMQRVGYASAPVSIALGVVIGLTPVGSTVVGWLGGLLGGSRMAQLVLGVLAIVLVTQIVGLPFAVWRHKVLLRFGLTTQKWGAWAVDQLKGFLVLCLMMAVMLASIYGGIGLSPQWWWLWAICLMVVLFITFGFVFPIWIAPIFFKFSALEEGSLRERILGMAAQTGVTLREIYVVDASRRTTTHNAAVAGYGRTRRVLLFDTLLGRSSTATPQAASNDGEAAKSLSSARLSDATESQVMTIVAHELAHAKFQDTIVQLFSLCVQFAALLCGIYLLNGWSWLLGLVNVTSITDPRAVGLLIGIIGVSGQILKPLINLVSRRLEASADWHALVFTDDPKSFEGAWRKIVEINLADPNPGRLQQLISGAHPTVVERIAMARGFKRLANTK